MAEPILVLADRGRCGLCGEIIFRGVLRDAPVFLCQNCIQIKNNLKKHLILYTNVSII